MSKIIVGTHGKKRKKEKVLGKVKVISREEYEDMEIDARVEIIQALIPLGLLYV